MSVAIADPTDSVERDTIYALSSGRLPAAIAIVRISGPRAFEALVELGGDDDIVPRTATLTTLHGRTGGEIDSGLVIWFPGPKSVTGEDLVELHLHGGVATVNAALAALAAFGLRLAEPGEFTRRSFRNGKMAAGEVEALADLLEAETDYQRREALSRTRRHGGRAVLDWSRRLTDIAATIEAAIEQDYEDGDDAVRDDVLERCAAIRVEIEAALDGPSRSTIRDGARIVIVGAPNAGKSTLFNALVGLDRAIVTPVPGTTRDMLEHSLSLGGYPATLIDTAGLRETDDPVETIGVARGREAAASADIVIDLDEAAPCHPRRIAVRSKADAMPAVGTGTISISGMTGLGLPVLLEALVRHLADVFPVPEHRLASAESAAARQAAQTLVRLNAGTDLVVAAEQVRLARSVLGEVGGADGPEPVLDAVYARFCLGK